ncbi:MAG: hypothetical protein I8H94_04470 [Rhodobacteraceae bacterium]|nr:hypothetical protein [Paracoccaceae bacterium]
MSPIEKAIRATLENVPAVMFVAALIIATFFSSNPGMADRYLTWLLFLAVGVQGLWAGTTHVFFPKVGARYIGWDVSPFQAELGVADLAIGFVAILSFWQGLEFKAALVAYLVVFYLGVGLIHIRDAKARNNHAKGNFGALLGMTLLKAVTLPVLLWLAIHQQALSPV